MANLRPSWRKIEAALIELLREEGLELSQVACETCVHTYDIDGQETEISLADFAKELEARIS